MIKIKNKRKILNIASMSALIACAVALFPITANAQPEGGLDALPAAPSIQTQTNRTINEDEHTHPPIRLTPDKSEIINLDQAAGSIIIGNPNHLSILADSASRLILVPRAPGASYFTILDRSGNIIMQRHAIIASPKKKYVRIRRSCANASDDCQETKVFYCPDMCHEIKIDNGEDSASSDGAEAADGNNNSDSAGSDDSGEGEEE